VGSLLIYLLQISNWVRRWKNCENRSIFSKDMDKSIMYPFFDSRCILHKFVIYKWKSRKYWNWPPVDTVDFSSPNTFSRTLTDIIDVSENSVGCVTGNIYKTCIILVLLVQRHKHGQTSDWSKIDALHHLCQWHILQIKWYDHVSNQEVISQTGLSSTGDIISCRRLGLFGHVAQLDR